MTIDILKRDLRRFRTLAFNVYDKQEALDALIAALAFVIDNRQDRENPVRLDEDFFFPEAYRWEDEGITVEGIDRIEFTVPLMGYTADLPYNRVNIGRPNTVAVLSRLVPKLGPAFKRLQTRQIMEVFRLNPLAYDGQNFWSDAHPHPANKGTYDNIIDFPFADPARPTEFEMQDLLHEVKARFLRNLTIQAEVLDAAEITKSVLAITHNDGQFSALDKVRTKSKIGDEENELRGSFTLLVDAKPTAGQENYMEFVLSEPGGPRPAFLVLDQDPELDAFENSRYNNAYVAVGMKGIHGVKPGYPHSAIQVRPAA